MCADVGDALHKVELLKNNLNETEEQNFSLLKQTKEKDAEIQRLTELNKYACLIFENLL